MYKLWQPQDASKTVLISSARSPQNEHGNKTGRPGRRTCVQQLILLYLLHGANSGVQGILFALPLFFSQSIVPPSTFNWSTAAVLLRWIVIGHQLLVHPEKKVQSK